MQITIALLLVVANGFFVASEFSLARVRPTQSRAWLKEGRRGAKSVAHGVTHIDSYLAACQLGITLSSIGLGFVGKPAFAALLKPLSDPLGETIPGVGAYAMSFALAYGLVTFLHVVFGELSPKSMAIARTERTALAMMPLLRAFYYATKPLVDFFNWMGNLVLKPFGVPPASESSHVAHSEDELRHLLLESAKSGTIEPEEQLLAENVFRVTDAVANQVSVPRRDIEYLTVDQTLDDAFERVLQTKHSRLPLCGTEQGIDDPIGVVLAMDLLDAIRRPADDQPTLQQLARPILVTTENLPLPRLLRELRQRRQRMALLADEYGTVSGVVTIEDIVEEVFGEMYDEYDTEIRDGDPAGAIQLENGSVELPGSWPLHDLGELGIDLKLGDDGSIATVAGAVLHRLGAIPDEGATIEFEHWRVVVLAVQSNAITRIRLEPLALVSD
jgi:CBS domain containing-hemolysin-like protein